jgi:hypothetical protein
MSPPPDPPAPKKWEIEWRCPLVFQNQQMPEEHFWFINDKAIEIVKKYKPDGTTILIRAPIHNTTRINGVAVTDRRGYHFTAEFLTKAGDWASFHFYVTVQKENVRPKDSLRGEPNPEIFWNTAGKSVSGTSSYRFETVDVE